MEISILIDHLNYWYREIMEDMFEKDSDLEEVLSAWDRKISSMSYDDVHYMCVSVNLV